MFFLRRHFGTHRLEGVVSQIGGVDNLLVAVVPGCCGQEVICEITWVGADVRHELSH